MNAVSTVLTVDIYKQYLGVGKDDNHYLNAGRAFTVLGGVLMIVTALPLVSAGMDTFLPMSFFISSATVGGLGGIFLIGFFSKRVNTPGIYLGILTCVITTIYLTLSGIELESLEGSNPAVVAFFTWFEPYKSPTHNYLIGVFANIASFVVGYFGSYLFPAPSETKLRRATYWTLEPSQQGAKD
jgi:SSS family solute:Na+ symporter